MDNNLRRLDLNLLLTLDTLLAEGNVTRAAQRLNLAQPTVSLQLRRLREALGDPLLLPGPRGMQPTARAVALRQPLHRLLDELAQLLVQDDAFDPALATHTWRIGASDYSATALLWPVLPTLRQQAPGLRIAVLDPRPTDLAAALESDRLDLALHVRDEAAPALRQRLLCHERYVLAGRQDHPELVRPLTLERFCQLDQAMVSPEGGGFVGSTDQALAAQGLQRRVVLSVAHFAALVTALTGSDLIALVPERLARSAAGLRVQPPPLALPGFAMALLWPERLHRDPGHRWLRDAIAVALPM